MPSEKENRSSMNQSRLPSLDTWFQSAKKGDVETLCNLLEDKQVGKVDVQDRNRRTALYFAAREGQETGVSALLELGADPNW